LLNSLHAPFVNSAVFSGLPGRGDLGTQDVVPASFGVSLN